MIKKNGSNGLEFEYIHIVGFALLLNGLNQSLTISNIVVNRIQQMAFRSKRSTIIQCSAPEELLHSLTCSDTCYHRTTLLLTATNSSSRNSLKNWMSEYVKHAQSNEIVYIYSMEIVLGIASFPRKYKNSTSSPYYVHVSSQLKILLHFIEMEMFDQK